MVPASASSSALKEKPYNILCKGLIGTSKAKEKTRYECRNYNESYQNR
jgi:hypothetical protein